MADIEQLHDLPAAIVAACCCQVLLLDADNLPLLDPAQLFELKEFATHGSLFWPDFWHKNWLKEEFYKILGQDVPWEIDSEYRSSESGQVTQWYWKPV